MKIGELYFVDWGQEGGSYPTAIDNHFYAITVAMIHGKSSVIFSQKFRCLNKLFRYQLKAIALENLFLMPT